MTWILDNLQIVVAIAAGIAYWINNLRQAKQEQQEEYPSPEEREDDFEPYYDPRENESRPVISLPPPLFRQLSPPPLPVEDDGELARQQQLQERLQQARANKAANRSSTEVSRSWLKKKAVAGVSGSGSLKSQLKNRREVRKAFVMREILGPPTSLR